MAAGTYKRIPVCKELYADSYTPVEMMRILHKASHHCYLLESASQNEVWGRYSFLGYDPSMEITCTDGTLRIRRTKEAMEAGENGTDSSVEEIRQVTHPGDAIREIIEKYKSSPELAILPLPGKGGSMGVGLSNIKSAVEKAVGADILK